MRWTDPYESRFLRVDPAGGHFQVHRSAYADPAVFAEEKKLIFDRTWQFIGHESELDKPHDFVRRDFAGRRTLFCKDGKGVIRAFLNTCPHRGAQVCQDNAGNRRTFTCPYHGWVFRNSGELLNQGNSEGSYGPDFNDGRYNLQAVPRLESRAGFYFVNFDANAPSLDSWLGEAGDRLDLLALHSAAGLERIRGVHEYSIKANYKLLCENSYDGYHVFATHERYLEYLMKMYGKLDQSQIAGRALGLSNGHASFELRIPTGRPIAQAMPNWSDQAKADVEAKKAELEARVGPELADIIANTNRNMVLFPNSIINDQQTILVRSIVPLAHNEMLVRAFAFAPKDETPELRKARIDGALSFLGPGGFATPDDVEMLELCQIGFENTDAAWQDLSKGFGPGEDSLTGRSTYNNELQMRAYWTQWDIMMTGGPAGLRLPIAAE